MSITDDTSNTSGVNAMTLGGAIDSSGTIDVAFDIATSPDQTLTIETVDAGLALFASENAGGTYSVTFAGTVSGSGTMGSTQFLADSSTGTITFDSTAFSNAANDAGTYTVNLVYAASGGSETSTHVVILADSASITVDATNHVNATSDVTVNVDGGTLTETLSTSTLFAGLAASYGAVRFNSAEKY